MAVSYAIVSHLISNRRAAMDVYRLHLHRPVEIAEELTLLDAEMLRKIHSDELRDGAWLKAKKHELAPNVMAMVRTFNHVALLVPTEILAETTPQTRAKIISSFIRVASKCYQLRNYNSLQAVLAGLQCTPIYRLKKTWKEVPSKRRKRFKQLSELMSEQGNWMMYRRDLEQQFAANIPCIPFFGIFLTQIMHQDSYNQCKAKTGDVIRKRLSGLENYTILEAITARNQLEKLTQQHSVTCITIRGVGHEESEPTIEADDTQSPLEPAQSTVTQPVQPSEQHLEGERQQASLQNPSRPLQFSQNTVVAVSPCVTNRAKHCSLIRTKSFSDHALDVMDLSPKFNNIDFADDSYMHSQKVECLQDDEPSSIESSPFSADSPDSPDGVEEQIPMFKFPPRLKSTMSLPNGSLSPTSWASSIYTHNRRATEVVLRPKLVQLNCSTSPSDLLRQYKFFSLGCCRGIESRAKLRALLTCTAHNTEGQNYKLSYQTEPQ